MNLTPIKNVFIGLIGTKEYDIELFDPIIEMAFEKINNRLKDGVVFSSNNIALIYAVAAVAFYHYSTIQSSKESSGSVKVGNVTVNSREEGNIERIKDITNNLLLLAKDFIHLDTTFYFSEVKS